MSAIKIVELDDTNTCKICDNALAKYSCPKCNIIYCSLDCYQSSTHLECSETFYKDNIIDELGLDKDSNESKSKMLEILKRHHQLELNENEDEFGDCSGFNIEDYLNLNSDESEELDSDDELVNICDRLNGVDLNDTEQVWGKLTEDEKQDFVAFLKSEDIANLIPSWQPWWLYYNSKKVEDINDDDDEEYKKNCPKINSIKDFAELTSKPPSDCVQYNLINILCAYVFTTRYFNGEHFDFCQEAVSCIATVSNTLKNGQNFTDFETSVVAVEQECINSDWIVTDAENIQIMRLDVEKILKGPKKSEPKFYILSALSDFENLLKQSLKPKKTDNSEFSKQFPNEHFPTVKLEDSQNIKNYLRKVEYFLSYTKDVFQL